MDLVTGAMGRLIPKLLKMLGDEYKLQTGMKKKVQFLARELDSIHAFLCKVSDVPWDQLDDQVKLWAREAREASYDMEDILDSFLVRVKSGEANKNPSRLKRAMKKMANLFSEGKARHDIGSAIKNIKSQLQEVADRRARYRIDDIVVKPAAITVSTVDPRLQAIYKEVASLVGINKPRDDLISMLSSRVDDRAGRKKIVSLVGIGGIGKTTLAKAVYEKIRADFKCGAFVPVGRNPNLSKVLMDILYELDKNKFGDIHSKNRDERQLIDNLREFLVDKRYCIVIDDIWENRSWIEAIELGLLENNCGSRIIITTRNSHVARRIGDEVYIMPPLSDENSVILFSKRISGDEGKFDNELDEVPNKILKKCAGVPLAIVTVASLLVGKPREKWSDVVNSIGFGHIDGKQMDITMKILSFSYYDMPAYLRTCLLYLSVFPEDYMIDRESLIWRWIAEGFIQEKPGIMLFELGEQYLNDLVSRSMVQAIDSELDGMVRKCSIHDMVLDLIRSISSNANFVTILESGEGAASLPPHAARRLALHDNNIEHTAHANTVDMPKVRSFVVIGCDFGNWIPFSTCKLLRILDLEGCRNVRPSHLVHLGNLLHLRYLGLGKTQIDDLPSEIGNLKFLMTLNLENTHIMQLQPSISRLTQLVCLKCNWFSTLAPDWIGKLTFLEELQVLIDFSNGSDEDPARDFLKALGSLRELRVFRSQVFEMDESMQQDLVLSLRNLRKLQSLELTFVDLLDADTALWGEDFVFPRHLRVLYLHRLMFSRLPPCIGSACLPNLTHLSLRVNHMDQRDLEFLGRLPELYYLRLFTNSTSMLSSTGVRNGYFRKLIFCRMSWSMIQLQFKAGDSRVSFHIWNGTDVVPFCLSENGHSMASYVVMPNLEVLYTQVFVRSLKDGNSDCCNIIGFEYLPSLRIVKVLLNCASASSAEVDEVEATLRKATEVHSNCPVLEVRRSKEHEMISDVEDKKGK